MYELVKEKFENSYDNNSYRRFNSTHPFDLYIGRNEEGKKSLVLISIGKTEKVESSRMIKVTLSQRGDESLVLSFDLLEDDMSDLFYKFCSDVIESSRNISEANIISFVIKRWRDWISLFKNPLVTLLTELEIRGLLGELIYLNNYMFEKYGFERSLHSWMGPDMSHKDFEIDDTWYEIKTISQNGLTVKISSIEQLDSNNIGKLVVIKLEASNIEVSSNITLNDYIAKIRMKLPNDLRSLFDKKIDQSKYKYAVEYDRYVYLLKGISCYEVNNGFPRIKKENLPNGVVRTNYELLLESINDFKIVGE